MSLREPFAQFIYRSAAAREERQDARSSAGDLVIYSLRKWIRPALNGNSSGNMEQPKIWIIGGEDDLPGGA